MIFLLSDDEHGLYSEEVDGRSDLDIKEAVRARDGYRCRDCGMTQEEHLKQYEQILEVHRLIPGIGYEVGVCVTLCVNCHKPKPRNVQTALWHKDLRWFVFNLYDEEDAGLYRALQSQVTASGVGFETYMGNLLRDKLAAFVAHDSADAHLTADGLW